VLVKGVNLVADYGDVSNILRESSTIHTAVMTERPETAWILSEDAASGCKTPTKG
jgi:hypothetical protein